MLQDLLQKKKRIPIDLIYTTFQKGQTYSSNSIKKKFQKIYADLGLDINPKGTDIKDYFEVRDKNAAVKGKSKRAYLLLDYKFSGSPEYRRQ